MEQLANQAACELLASRREVDDTSLKLSELQEQALNIARDAPTDADLPDYIRKGLVLVVLGLPVADQLANEVYRDRHSNGYRYADEGDTKLHDLQTHAFEIVRKLVEKDGHTKQGAIRTYARKRLHHELEYDKRDIVGKKQHKCDEKDSHFTRQKFKDRHHATPKVVDEPREPDLYAMCNGEWETRTLELLDASVPIKDISRRQRCSTKTVCGFKKKLLNRKPKWCHDPKHNPSILKTISDEDSWFKFKTYCCPGPFDQTITELYRKGFKYDSIAAKVVREVDWVKDRLWRLGGLYFEL